MLGPDIRRPEPLFVISLNLLRFAFLATDNQQQSTNTTITYAVSEINGDGKTLPGTGFACPLRVVTSGKIIV